jgi:hypothetical protein
MITWPPRLSSAAVAGMMARRSDHDGGARTRMALTMPRVTVF